MGCSGAGRFPGSGGDGHTVIYLSSCFGGSLRSFRISLLDRPSGFYGLRLVRLEQSPASLYDFTSVRFRVRSVRMRRALRAYIRDG